MAFFPELSYSSAPSRLNIISAKRFRGLNIAVNATQIKDTETPDMLNMELDDNGALDKRRGYASQFETPLSETIGITRNGLIEYPKSTGTIYLVAHDTKLYTWDVTNQTTTEVFDGLSGNQLFHFTFGDFLYILDGTT